MIAQKKYPWNEQSFYIVIVLWFTLVFVSPTCLEAAVPVRPVDSDPDVSSDTAYQISSRIESPVFDPPYKSQKGQLSRWTDLIQ